MVTPDNFTLKFGTRDYVDKVTYYTIFDVDRFSGGFLPKQVKYKPFVTFSPVLSCPACTVHFYRASYASAVLGVVILSVRPSVTRVLCD